MNNALDDLSFLCFDHHDEFDSTTSQRKGLTLQEVKAYREELYRHLSSAFSQPVHFGEVITPPTDPFAGKYTLINGLVDSAEVLITPIPDTMEGTARYMVSGQAIWGTNREFDPNIGVMDFVGIMEDDSELRWGRLSGDQETLSVLTFDRRGGLHIAETNWIGAYGMNVTFEGDYKRS